MFIKKTRGLFVFCFSLSMIFSLLSLKAAEQDETIMKLHPQLEEKARLFHSLHQGDDLLILPNAWDALSAKIFEQEGAKAIATTSAGMAATFGYADGQKFPKDLLFVMVDRIVKSVSVPVTVDLEAGFGDTVEEICETVSSILKIGAEWKFSHHRLDLIEHFSSAAVVCHRRQSCRAGICQTFFDVWR